MMTSGQVAGMIQQQNQHFAGAAAYSRQISQQMPGAYGGGGGFPAFAQAPGGLPQQGGFSYNSGGSTAAFSNQAGGGVVSAMGGAAQFGLGAAGIAAGFGMMGSVGGAALDPFVGGGAGWRMGGRMAAAGNFGKVGTGAMRLGMGAMGMLPAAGLLMGASHMIGSTMAGAQEQAQVENVLSRQQMGGSVGTNNFSRTQAKGIGDMMKGMEALPEMMTSMSELTRIMDKMGTMGVMSGTQNVAEFKDKFKQNIKLLKDMSKVMASSMEEALPMFGEIRRSGFYSTGDVLKNAMNRQITKSVTGMDAGQVNQVAQYGAQLGHQTGGSRAGGAKHSLRMANQIGMAKQMGVLSEEDIMEMTGASGAEGVQALSIQLTRAGHKMSRGGLGTATTAALAEKVDGRFTGQMDAGLVDRFRAGEFSVSDLKSMAHKNVSGRKAKMSWAAQHKGLRSEMVAAVGVEGQFQMLQNALGGRGFDNPDAMRIVSQRFGLDEKEAEMMMKFGEQMPDISIKLQQQGRMTAKKLATDSFMKENYSWGAIKSKFTKRIDNAITQPFKKFGADMRNNINHTIDSFVDEMTGQYEVEITKGLSGIMQGSMAGNASSKARLRNLMQESGFNDTKNRPGDFAGTKLSGMANYLTGTQTSGEASLQTLKLLGVDTFKSSSASGLQRRGVAALSADRNVFSADTFEGARVEDIRAASNLLRDMGRGGGDRGKKIQEIMKQNPDLSDSLISDATYASRNMLSMGGSLTGWDKIAEGGYSTTKKDKMTQLRAKLKAAGLGDVSDLELSQSALGTQGLTSAALNEELAKEAKRMGGLAGTGSSQESAERVKDAKFKLQKMMGDKFATGMAVMDKYAGTAAGAMLFGEGGLLTGTEEGEYGRVYDETGVGGVRARVFEGGKDSREARMARGAGQALSAIVADTDSEYGTKLDPNIRNINAKNRQQVGRSVMQAMASDIANIGEEAWLKRRTKGEKRFWQANKAVIRRQAKNQKLTDVLQRVKNGGKPSQEDKAWVAANFKGVDPDEVLTKEGATSMLDLKAFGESEFGQGALRMLKDMGLDMTNIALQEGTEQLRDAGNELLTKLSDTRGLAEDAGIELGESAEELLGAMEKNAQAMSEGDLTATLKYGEMAEKTGDLSDDEKSLLFAADPRLSAAHTKTRTMNRRWKRLSGRGKGADDIQARKGEVGFSKMFSLKQLQNMSPELRKSLKAHAGKDMMFDADEQKAVTKELANRAASGDIAASGITGKNVQASSADIATHMSSFIDSTTKLAELVQVIAKAQKEG